MSLVASLREGVAAVVADPDLRTLFPVFAAFVLVGNVYAQALPLFAAAIGVSAGAFGVAKGVANAAEIVASPASGALSDRVDRFGLGATVAVALAVLFPVLALAGSAVALAGAMVAVAVVRLALTNAITPAVNDALEEGLEGVGWGVRDVGIYLASAVGLAAGGVVLSTVGRPGYVLAGLAPVSLAVAVVLARRADGPPTGATDLRVAASALTDVSPVAALRSAPRPWLLARLLSAEFLVGLGMGASTFLLPLLAIERGFTGGGYLLAYAAATLLAAPLSLVGGGLADRYSRKWLYVGNFAVEAAMLAAFAVAGRTAFLVGLGLFTLQTTFEPAVIAYFFDRFDDEDGGTAWGIKGMVSRGTGVVAPAAGGVLFAISPGLPYLVGAVLTAAGALVATTLPRG